MGLVLLKSCVSREWPLELTFRLDKMEVTGDFDKQFPRNDKNKCLPRVDQRANAHTFSPQGFDVRGRKWIRSKLEEAAGSRILVQGSYGGMCLTERNEPKWEGMIKIRDRTITAGPLGIVTTHNFRSVVCGWYCSSSSSMDAKNEVQKDQKSLPSPPTPPRVSDRPRMQIWTLVFLATVLYFCNFRF